MSIDLAMLLTQSMAANKCVDSTAYQRRVTLAVIPLRNVAMSSRKALLQSVITYATDYEAALSALRKLPWDSEPEVILTKDHVRSILERFKSGELSAEQIERWAEALEVREDIDADDVVQRAIFSLANPSLEGQLGTERINEVYLELNKAV